MFTYKFIQTAAFNEAEAFLDQYFLLKRPFKKHWSQTHFLSSYSFSAPYMIGLHSYLISNSRRCSKSKTLEIDYRNYQTATSHNKQNVDSKNSDSSKLTKLRVSTLHHTFLRKILHYFSNWKLKLEKQSNTEWVGLEEESIFEKSWIQNLVAVSL